jgi:hypothetical protein
MPPKIVLPNARSIKISGGRNLVDVFDLRDSEISIFKATTMDDNVTIDLSSFHDQIAKISLSKFEWTEKPVRPRHFNDLMCLNLKAMRIHGTLGEYLRLPNLRSLGLSGVKFRQLENTGAQGHSWSLLFSDTQFIQGSPFLETIYLSNQELDESFVEGLRSCTSLKTFILLGCDLDRFVFPFLKHLNNGELVPSLDTIRVSEFWRMNLTMSLEEFSERVVAKRPNVRVSSDRARY